MSVQLSDLEFAYQVANEGPISAAWIHKEDSLVKTADQLVDDDEFPPADDSEWAELPSAKTLRLDTELAKDFSGQYCPHLTSQVQDCFAPRESWECFRELLARHDLLSAWDDYVLLATRTALMRWANDRAITVIDDHFEGRTMSSGGQGN